MSSYTRYPPRYPLIAYLWPLALLVVLGACLLWRFWPQNGLGVNPSYPMRPVTPRGDLMELEKTTISIYQTAAPSVVHITTLRNARGTFKLNVQQVPEGTGSGIIWDEDGHIVTNYHVLQDADAAEVTFGGQSTWQGELVGAYEDKDLAVLWIAAPKSRLRPILIGESHNLQVGQSVFAIGDPFGLDQTLTSGIVSALGREMQSVNDHPIRNVIQTDAPINPGNSGGPLLDSAGRLIGVNSSIISPSGAFAGIGFAIPVDEVNRVVTQLIRYRKVVRPYLGVEVAPDQLATKLGVTGALVMKVQPGSPAAKAGIQATRRDAQHHFHLGDVIEAIDDNKIETVNDLFAALDKYKAGDTVTLTLLRDGKEEKVKVTLTTAE